MVEGPGCKLKGEKIRSRLLKQSVKTVNGNAVDREQKKLKVKIKTTEHDSTASTADTAMSRERTFDGLVGQTLQEVLTLGKELFMFFGQSCLRIHFLMAGSFRINDAQVDMDGGRKIPNTANLEIQFSKDKLTFYKCAAEIRPSSACHKKFDNLKDLDICSPVFNAKRAVTEMMVETDRQLCDVLLDQDILPGVGNIIKNEALFDSGLKPDSKISELSEEHIAHLVKMTRDFSMVFYKCRKTGTNLRQYMKVYQKGTCGECGTKIVMTRMGEDSERVTYFCPACQDNSLNSQGRLKLPSKNSLLGWVQGHYTTTSATEEWACQQCTLLNPATQTNCSVCFNPRTPCLVSTHKTQAHLSCGNSLPVKRKLQDTSLSLAVNERKKARIGVENLKAGSERIGTEKVRMETENGQTGTDTARIGTEKSRIGSEIDETETEGSRIETNNILWRTGSETTRMGTQISQLKVENRRIGTEIARPGTGKCKTETEKARIGTEISHAGTERLFSQKSFRQSSQTLKNSQSSGHGSVCKIPACPGHGMTCAMRQTFKQNENKGRWFFTCAAQPAKKQCKFFKWADEQFPVCTGHGTPCALRTVMKQGPNNGRRFFCCPVRKNGCHFFEWAVGYDH